MSNRLTQESSPYLLQHQDNPVQWYPWGNEAIEKASREDKPIFLSIGYSACHWCHVMEHESFEDEGIAQLINEHFVPIKVDREERPDLDQIYMNAVQMLTGRGGWPMSVFLTPELKPFYGGTYWPPHASRGMPGFDQILLAVSDAWQNRRQQALEGAEQITDELRRVGRPFSQHSTGPELSAQWLDAAAVQLCRSHDATFGGFGSAPKFPHPMAMQLLLRQWHRGGKRNYLDVVCHTLDHMASGGIYDHLGGGFARYSVDDRWLVPHFEKMLYDNALLAGVYLDAHLATGAQQYARVVRETLDYILRDMTDPEGGFYSSEDADSEGEEGKFYTWTPEEVASVLGDDQALTFCRVYDITTDGNFEGRSILNLPKTMSQAAALLGQDADDVGSQLAASRATLLATRDQRVRPGRDDKVIVAWNGLMIDSLARAGAALAESRYVEAAARAAGFLLSQVRRAEGRLLHTWRGGQAKLDAYLDDYTCLANALVSLYEATFDERWIDEAVLLLDTVLEHFADEEEGGFFFTASDHEALITRTKEFTDASTPSGNGMAAFALLRLGRLLGRSDYLDAAVTTLDGAKDFIRRAPLGTGQLLLALDLYIEPTYELLLMTALNEDAAHNGLREIRRRYLPNCVIGARSDSNGQQAHRSRFLDQAFAGKQAVNRKPTLFVCQNFTCDRPVSGVAAIEQRLGDIGP